MSEQLPIMTTMLSADEIALLRCIAGHMIPASGRHGVPGADDPLILREIAGTLGRDTEAVQTLLAAFNHHAGNRLTSLPGAEQAILIDDCRQQAGAAVAVLVNAVVRCYYRDDRVMQSLGLEPRPPFPQGHVLPEGDWVLLDPVRARGPIWRKV